MGVLEFHTAEVNECGALLAGQELFLLDLFSGRSEPPSVRLNANLRLIIILLRPESRNQNPENKQKMAAELVDAATSTNLAEMDWGKNIEICELAANDQKYGLETFQLVIL